MTEANEINKLKQVIQKVEPQSKLLRTWELKGALSTRMMALELERPDSQTKKMIVRQYADGDLTHNPHVAADEFKLLQLLQSLGVAAPLPAHLDESREIFSTPYLVMEYIEGEPEFAPPDGTDFIFQIATHFSRLHAVDCSHLDLSFLPQQEKRIAEKLRARPTNMLESGDERQIRDVLEAVWPLPQRNPSVLIHGDFWPGNILWKEGQLVAVIDWENAALGDPLADCNLFHHFGVLLSRRVIGHCGRKVMDQDEEDLLSLLATDLDRHFRQLVLLYQQRLYSFALRLIGNPQDAEDIVQETFLRSYHALKSYPVLKVRAVRLRQWLYTITLNIFRNRQRKSEHQSISLDTSEGSPLLEIEDPSSGPEEETDLHEWRRELEMQLASLSEHYRVAVTLYYLEDLSYVEIAELLNQPVGTVKARVHRALRQLHKALQTQTNGVR